MKHVLNIQGAIKRQGYSVGYVAKQLGVTPTAVSVMGKGRKPKSGAPRSVQIDTLEKIVNVIHCDLFDMWETFDDNGIRIFPYECKKNFDTSKSPISKQLKGTQSELF